MFKRALTPAQKQRRYRERLKARAQSSTDDTAQVRIRELEEQLEIAADKFLKLCANFRKLEAQIDRLQTKQRRGQPEPVAHVKHVQYALTLYDLLSTYAASINRRAARLQTKRQRKPRR